MHTLHWKRKDHADRAPTRGIRLYLDVLKMVLLLQSNTNLMAIVTRKILTSILFNEYYFYKATLTLGYCYGKDTRFYTLKPVSLLQNNTDLGLLLQKIYLLLHSYADITYTKQHRLGGYYYENYTDNKWQISPSGVFL